MASLVRVHDTRFADELALNTIFSVFRDGRDEVQVIAAPRIHKNMVGEKSFVVAQVKRLRTGEVGEMIFHNTCPVFVRVNVSRGTSRS